MSWSPDGRLLAFNSITGNLPYFAKVNIWRTDSWERVAKLPGLKGEAPVAWHPRLPLIATAWNRNPKKSSFGTWT